MKPVKRRTMHNSCFLSGSFNTSFGADNTVRKISGSTKKLGQNYQNATVVLFNKQNMQAIAVSKPDASGNYQFPGLNVSLSCFLVGFDNAKLYNAVIQDNVVPK